MDLINIYIKILRKILHKLHSIYTMTISLNQLVKTSVLKKTSCRSFLSLFNQLDQKIPISENEISSCLLEVNERESTKYRGIVLDYSLTVSFSDEKRLSIFWAALIKLSKQTQTLYFKKISEYLSVNGKRIPKEVLKTFINNHLVEYTMQIMKDTKLDHLDSVVYQLVFLWCLIIQKDYSIDKFDFLKSSIITFLSSNPKNRKLLNYFVEVMKRKGGERSMSVVDSSGTTSSISGSNIAASNSFGVSGVYKLFDNPQSSKRYPKLVEVKRAIWINSLMENWIPIEPKAFLKQFESQFFVKSTNNGKKNGILLNEIIKCVFSGGFSTDYVTANRKIFICTKLVLITGELELSKLEIEEVIQESFKEIDDLSIKQDFVKSCIFNSVLDIGSFTKIFPQNPPTTSLNSEMLQFKNNTINGLILEDLNKRLIDVNSEFTSLEELGLVEYMSGLQTKFQYCLSRQRELREIVNNLLDQFIKEKSNDKLSRLLLLLLSSGSCMTLSMIFSELDPLPFLCKIIKYVDQLNITGGHDNEDLTAGGDSSDEYQDSYSQFGIILLSIIQIIDYFQIHQSDLIIKQSFTLDYLNNFYYRLCEGLTNENSMGATEEDQTIITNYNSLINDWIRSLFDENNEEGLSDELIKLVNIKQIYKIIPLIYQQAIISYNIGKIDIKTLNNGLDYLTQNFLIPCTLSIIKWLLRYITINSGDFDNLRDVLAMIIKSNLVGSTSSDQILVFKLVLNCCSKDILAILPTQDSKSQEIRILVENNIEKAFTSAISKDFQLDGSFKSYLLKVIENPRMLNRNILDFYFNHEQKVLASLILEDINYHNHGNEDTRLVFNLLVFILRNRYLQSEDNKRYWKEEIDKSHTVTSDNNKKGEEEDINFKKSMVFHYSSIFNIPEDEESNEDDLFNDNFGIFDNANSDEQLPLIVNQKILHRKTSVLGELIRINNKIKSKPLGIVLKKIIDDDAL